MEGHREESRLGEGERDTWEEEQQEKEEEREGACCSVVTVSASWG